MRTINTYSGDFSSAPPSPSTNYEYKPPSGSTNRSGGKDGPPTPDRNFVAQLFGLMPRKFQLGCYAGIVAVCFYSLSIFVEAVFPSRSAGNNFEEQEVEPGFGFRGSIRH